jgi:hypothetical protein
MDPSGRNLAMRLEQLCEMELAYREENVYGGKVAMVRPYAGEEGSAYGEGEGTVNGPRLKGKVRWVNHPHRRSDGVMLPNVHGIVATEDGALILFSLSGRTIFNDHGGAQLLSVTLEAEDKRYRWLNNTFCVLEGTIDPVSTIMRARIYQCINELVEEA